VAVAGKVSVLGWFWGILSRIWAHWNERVEIRRLVPVSVHIAAWIGCGGGKSGSGSGSGEREKKLIF
jgi:hypothetical protein